jgi:hypothetical protein
MGDSWDMGIGYEGAVDAYVGGWAEGAQRAYEMADKLRPRPQRQRTTLERSVTGAFPNVGANLAGAPNAMYRVGKKSAKSRPFVDLHTVTSLSSNVTADDAFNRGCAIVALIDSLESAGCRVRITLHERYDDQDMRFEVKDYSDRLDIDQLIFTAAHPAFLRRICFALQERSPNPVARASTRANYGRPQEIKLADLGESRGNVTQVILPAMRTLGAGKGPEGYLKAMVNALPEDIRTEIEG